MMQILRDGGHATESDSALQQILFSAEESDQQTSMKNEDIPVPLVSFFLLQGSMAKVCRIKCHGREGILKVSLDTIQHTRPRIGQIQTGNHFLICSSHLKQIQA